MKNSMKWVMWIAVVIVIVIVGFLIFKGPSMVNNPTGNTNNPGTVSPGSNNPGSTGSGSGNTPTTSNTHNVGIQNFAFSPSSETITKGDTVTWTNMDSVGHTITSDSGSEISSGTLSTGQTYSHTFNTAGTFNYHCSIHPMMKGTIIVQ